jgi:hypothetical protein
VDVKVSLTELELERLEVDVEMTELLELLYTDVDEGLEVDETDEEVELVVGVTSEDVDETTLLLEVETTLDELEIETLELVLLSIELVEETPTLEEVVDALPAQE